MSKSGGHDDASVSIAGIGCGRLPIPTRDFERLLKNENIDVIQCESAEAAELVLARAGADLSLCY